MKWLYVGGGEWLFGAKIRGAILHPRATVFPVGASWEWVVFSNPEGAVQRSGYCLSRAAAMRAVEAELGVAD
jgi:hypothetical protein